MKRSLLKQFAAVAVSLSMLLSMAACGTKPEAESTGEGAPSQAVAENTAAGENKIPDGTYKGEGSGRGGTISVEVTIAGDAITEIKVLESSETAGFEEAMDTLTKEIVSTNRVDVDIVSGCTMTSTGFLQAVNAALTAAGATPDMLKSVDGATASAQEKQVVEETHDVVVIGTGGAGFSAAIEAKMAGADVLMLEKMTIAGGNTLISGAELAAPGNWIQKEQNIEDSPEKMVQDMLKGGDNVNNPDLVKVVANNALDGAIWLRDTVNVVWEDELMIFGGHSVKRSLVPAGASGQEIITKQLAKAESLGIPIYYNTPALELLTDDTGRVTGVKAEGPESVYMINATKGVVIATGGFGSNVEMRKKYNPAVDESILSTNTVGSTGDGIIMAEAVGADLTGMEHIQTYPICDPLTGTLLYFDDSRLYGYTVIVNKEGKRFVEELGRRDEMSMAIKAQTGSCCYEILDQKGFDDSKIGENHAAEIQYLFDNGLLVKADTLEEAAKFFDIDAAEMIQSVENYNSYVDAGKDPEFKKRLLETKVETGPFYILKAVPAVHHTMGGIRINTEAQVLDKDGKVIEGLYAAGEVTGGIHGANRLGSCALSDITVFGRIAGQNVSK